MLFEKMGKYQDDTIIITDNHNFPYEKPTFYDIEKTLSEYKNYSPKIKKAIRDEAVSRMEKWRNPKYKTDVTSLLEKYFSEESLVIDNIEIARSESGSKVILKRGGKGKDEIYQIVESDGTLGEEIYRKSKENKFIREELKNSCRRRRSPTPGLFGACAMPSSGYSSMEGIYFALHDFMRENLPKVRFGKIELTELARLTRQARIILERGGDPIIFDKIFDSAKKNAAPEVKEQLGYVYDSVFNFEPSMKILTGRSIAPGFVSFIEGLLPVSNIGEAHIAGLKIHIEKFSVLPEFAKAKVVIAIRQSLAKSHSSFNSNAGTIDALLMDRISIYKRVQADGTVLPRSGMQHLTPEQTERLTSSVESQSNVSSGRSSISPKHTTYQAKIPIEKQYYLGKTDGKYLQMSRASGDFNVIPDGVFYYIVTNKEPLFIRMVSDSTPGGHYSLADNQPVLMAGECSFRDGKLEVWTNGSGHYQPGIEQYDSLPGPIKDTFPPAHFRPAVDVYGRKIHVPEIEAHLNMDTDYVVFH